MHLGRHFRPEYIHGKQHHTHLRLKSFAKLDMCMHMCTCMCVCMCTHVHTCRLEDLFEASLLMGAPLALIRYTYTYHTKPQGSPAYVALSDLNLNFLYTCTYIHTHTCTCTHTHILIRNFVVLAIKLPSFIKATVNSSMFQDVNKC